jgi:hypothetical protein
LLLQGFAYAVLMNLLHSLHWSPKYFSPRPDRSAHPHVPGWSEYQKFYDFRHYYKCKGF